MDYGNTNTAVVCVGDLSVKGRGRERANGGRRDEVREGEGREREREEGGESGEGREGQRETRVRQNYVISD